jgi:hypothetical protein
MLLARACQNVVVLSMLVCLVAPATAQGERPWVDPPPASAPVSSTPPAAAATPAGPTAAVPAKTATQADAAPARVERPRKALAPTPSAHRARAARIDHHARASKKPRQAAKRRIVQEPRVAERRVVREPRVAERRVVQPRVPRPRVAQAPPARVPKTFPSFNCQYARNSVERAICADPVLAAKDRRMALLYEHAGGSRHGPVDITQFRWLSARNACAAARELEDCIDSLYNARIAELSL